MGLGGKEKEEKEKKRKKKMLVQWKPVGGGRADPVQWWTGGSLALVAHQGLAGRGGRRWRTGLDGWEKENRERENEMASQQEPVGGCGADLGWW